MAPKFIKFLLIIIALLGSIMMVDAKRTNGPKKATPSRTVTRTVTKPVQRPPANTQKPVYRAPVNQQRPVTQPVNYRPPQNQQRPVTQPASNQYRPVTQPATRTTKVIKRTTVVRRPSQPIIVPGRQVVVPAVRYAGVYVVPRTIVYPPQYVMPIAGPLPLTLPQSCQTNPNAKVNQYRGSDQQRYEWNCAYRQVKLLGYMPKTCIVNGARSNKMISSYNRSTVTTYNYSCATLTASNRPLECNSRPNNIVYKYERLAIPALRYSQYDCRTNIGPSPAKASGIGMIIGIIIGVCICFCIMAAVCGSKGDDDHVDEEIIIEEEVVYEDAPPQVIYQDQVVYEQPQVVYQQPGYDQYQQPGYDQYQQPGTYVQDAGVDMYTGQQVINEVEM